MSNGSSTAVSDNKIRLIIGLMLVVAVLLVVLIAVNMRSQADESATSANVNNQAPTIDTVVISEASNPGVSVTDFNVTENSTKLMEVTGTYTDNNGCADVDTTGSMTLVFY